jgi:GH24 family phage-related lysozyme (muramidase)
MRMSDEGRKRLTQREGVRLKAYRDSVGIWTIGIGHTAAAGPPSPAPGMTITAKECDEIFRRDLVQYEDAVNKAVKVPLAQHQFDACVSFCYNIGTGGFARSTVVKRINAGDMEGAAKAFMMWVTPPEITGRRQSEVAQFKTPYPGTVTDIAKKAVRDATIAGGATGAAQGAEKTVSVPVDTPVPFMEILIWVLVIAALVFAASFAWRWWQARKAAAVPTDVPAAEVEEPEDTGPAGLELAGDRAADALAQEIANKAKGSLACQAAADEMTKPATRRKRTKRKATPAKRAKAKKRRAK